MRDRILKAWKEREFDEAEELIEVGIRGDLQERGYFKVKVDDIVSRLLNLTDGKQRVLIITSISEGSQFRLGTIIIKNAATGRALGIPAATLRDQFHIRDGNLFNMTEIRDRLERLKALYQDRGYADTSVEPETEPDDVSHRIDLILRITEGPHTS